MHFVALEVIFSVQKTRMEFPRSHGGLNVMWLDGWVFSLCMYAYCCSLSKHVKWLCLNTIMCWQMYTWELYTYVDSGEQWLYQNVKGTVSP